MIITGSSNHEMCIEKSAYEVRTPKNVGHNTLNKWAHACTRCKHTHIKLKQLEQTVSVYILFVFICLRRFMLKKNV